MARHKEGKAQNGHATKQQKAKDGAKSSENKFAAMSVNDFFSGGFEEDEMDSVASGGSDSDDEMKTNDKQAARKEAKPKVNGASSVKAKISREASKHKAQLESLKEKDPEFYEYLQKNDQELLDFDMSENEDADDMMSEGEDEEAADHEMVDEEGEDEDQDEDQEDDEELEGSEEEEEEPLPKEKKASKIDSGEGSTTLTKDMINTWSEHMQQTHSLRSLRRMLLAFRTAARMHDDEDAGFAYKIDDPAIFTKVIITTLKQVPTVLDHHLPPKRDRDAPTTAPKWRQLHSVVKSFLQNSLHLLKGLTDNDMIYFVVKELERCNAYWVCFNRLGRDYLKQLLSHWSNTSSSDSVRIQCFLSIRTLAKTSMTSTPATKQGPGKATAKSNFLELCLKGIYSTFVRNAKNTNIHTIPSINLMRNLAAQLYGLDFEISYQHGFVYIRQLAIHLRNSMNIKSKESYKSVYNWQFIHCLDFWTNVICDYCGAETLAELGLSESPLQPLIYPLVQVAIGVIRLIPTAQYFPLRFHVIRSITALIRQTGVFIPLAPYIFEVLESAEIKKKAKPGTMKPLDYQLYLKTPKQYMHTKVNQDGLLEEVYDTLLEYYACFSKSIAFPELVIPAIVLLKRNIKKSKNIKFNKQLHQLVDKLEANSKYIEQQRSRVEFSPTEQSQITRFLQDVQPHATPLGSFLSSHRKVKEQCKALLDSADVEED
ncbi:hypothetical protein BZG36_01559 [Bifiguratus adelaidae]|uniref:Nucleolar complex protein 2 n=1 Tax=Bifiguratus adelaidae TaxID=1938954 RepID=A0A261Y440_9FUNG|nr:hypothetical protein BZG36_01559 [Bifiguratus adelaidae]